MHKDGKGTTCSIGIGTGNEALSSCPQTYGFSIAAASKVSASKPCTNVPTRCTLCPEVHWKYNIFNHLAERHLSWQSQVNATTRQTWEISDEEKKKFASTEVATQAVSSAEPLASHGVMLLSSINENNKRPSSSPPGTPLTKEKQKHTSRKAQKTVRSPLIQDENVNPLVH